MKEQLNIIKVGGKIVEEESSLAALLRDFAALPGRKVLVHGGGRSATAMASRLGIETRMVDGRRVTDEAMLEVVTMVYAGLVNKRVVARLGALGVKALGLTGADMDVIRSHRRTGTQVDYGFVGDVDRVNADALRLLIEDGTVQGGMLPKLENSFAALRAGVKRVVITRADLLGQEGQGTVIELN